jgi:hypothetical protein
MEKTEFFSEYVRLLYIVGAATFFSADYASPLAKYGVILQNLLNNLKLILIFRKFSI